MPVVWPSALSSTSLYIGLLRNSCLAACLSTPSESNVLSSSFKSATPILGLYSRGTSSIESMLSTPSISLSSVRREARVSRFCWSNRSPSRGEKVTIRKLSLPYRCTTSRKKLRSSSCSNVRESAEASSLKLGRPMAIAKVNTSINSSALTGLSRIAF